ncbi:hypothetical protein ACSI5F_03790 [Ralstonia pseudosolanacearum]|uniref:hypothetical protein n=1 Tax=Ralstonia pseudosolanacearum TaxID=1310165 RepID=UPI003EDF33EC
MYRIYLWDPQQQMLPGSKTSTRTLSAALGAFAALVNRADLDGHLCAAVLSHNNQQIAYHRFDCGPGDANYWRDAEKLAGLEHATVSQHGGARPGSGRPAIGDARHNVTLPADVERYLRELGEGRLSAGIIQAVRRLRSPLDQ